MPHFYLHLINDRFVPDHEGTGFADAEAAREEAIRSAQELICLEIVRTGRIYLHHRIQIEDEGGTIVATVRFADAITIDATEKPLPRVDSWAKGQSST